MRRLFAPLALLVVLLAADAALAQGAGAADPVGDYRWAVYTACSFVFAAIVVYLILSHRRARRLAQDLDLLRHRVDGFEQGLTETREA